MNFVVLNTSSKTEALCSLWKILTHMPAALTTVRLEDSCSMDGCVESVKSRTEWLQNIVK